MTKLSEAVISEIADYEGVDPSDLEPPLYDYIDPEALDDLFAPKHSGDGRSYGQVRFRYKDYQVIVDTDANVVVYEETDTSSL
ncbi:MAG: HalOD1 output domain-containing protein [Halobacteria archaeon]|nr:HalOD1 output domain-containing protein [Halobacteria archaeon]